MALFYKRYIPPRVPVNDAPSQDIPTEHATKIHDPEPVTTKRKRHKADDLVSEEPAKKAKRKRETKVQPSGIKDPQQSGSAGFTPVPQLDDLKPEHPLPQPAGDFAHVKNAKKRHKLEKAARKERQAVVKKETRVNGETHTPATTTSRANKAGHQQSVRPTEPVNQHDEEGPSAKSTQKKTKAKHAHTGLESNETRVNEHSGLKGLAATDRTSPVAAVVEHQDAEAKPRLKKRRHKLEPILSEADGRVQAGAQEQDENDHLKKHGSILSKFQTSQSLSKALPSPVTQDEATLKEPPVLRDLVPLPLPEKDPTPEFQDMNILPQWLSHPTIVSSEPQAFVDLGLETSVSKHLANLGFTHAMPVQKSLIPLLLSPGTAGSRFLPGTEGVLPDVAVSARTGSGKTIAYMLPIVEALKCSAGSGKLRAVVVVPTRELVKQVAAVAESLTRGSRVRVGMATGAGSFKEEQTKLVRKGMEHNATAYTKILQKAHRRNYPPEEDSQDFEQFLDELDNSDEKLQQQISDTVSQIFDHVPVYSSAVDLLVATPGRLVEHLNSTLGFTLSHLQWLVYDEADKLLDLQHASFLDTINRELYRPRKEPEQDPRERRLRAGNLWDEQRERSVRKIVLSATMTRDISRLVNLKLKRPMMIVVRGEGNEDELHQASGAATQIGNNFELPPLLQEYCTHVGDGSEKPLYLLEVLRSRIMPGSTDDPNVPTHAAANTESDDSTSDADTDSDTDSDSDSNSTSSSDTCSTSSGSSLTSSLSDSSSDTSDAVSASSSGDNQRGPTLSHSPTEPSTTTAPTEPPTVLIFTSSTESATRLAHVLAQLHPPWAPHIHTLLKSRSTPAALARAAPSDPILAISTDRSARGLDALAGGRRVTHVLQYDVPRSVTSYVHRVGRTARVGRAGVAWTFFGAGEARWFVNAIVRARGIRRVGPVERVRIGVEADEEARERLRSAVEGMREVVMRGGKTGGRM